MQFIRFILMTCLLPGCTAFYVPTIGERVDVPAEYQRAVRLDDKLVLLYRTDVRAGLETVGSGAINWSSIHLRTIDWNVLGVSSQIVLTETAVEIEEAPPPNITAPPYTEVPIRYTELSENALDQLVADMRESVLNAEIAVNVVRPNLMLILVRKESEDKLLYKSVHIRGKHYQTWWALPARAAVVPGAVAVDSVTWPLWLIFFSGLH